MSSKSENRKQYMFVIKELTAREIKRKYARSFLGIIWSVLNPLLSMIVMSLIFVQIFDRTINNFPMYYLTGRIMWQLFTESTNSSLTALVDNKQMLIKVKLPMEIFIFARVYTALINLGYSLVAYIAMFLFFRIEPHWTIFLAPIVVICLLFFSLGIAYILATVYTFFGDIKHLYSIILTIWVNLSAIFYPVERLSGSIRIVIDNNPTFVYINCMRKILIWRQIPTEIDFIKMVAWGLGMYLIGLYVFKKNKSKIMQKL